MVERTVRLPDVPEKTATDAAIELQRFFDKHGLSKEERDALWGLFATIATRILLQHGGFPNEC